MFIIAQPKQAVLSCTVTGEASRSEIIFDYDPTDQTGQLEIGGKHIFASENSFGFSRERRTCRLRLYIKRRNLLSPERVAKIGLNDGKIGQLSFYPDYEPEDFVPGRPQLWKDSCS